MLPYLNPRRAVVQCGCNWTHAHFLTQILCNSRHLLSRRRGDSWASAAPLHRPIKKSPLPHLLLPPSLWAGCVINTPLSTSDRKSPVHTPADPPPSGTRVSRWFLQTGFESFREKKKKRTRMTAVQSAFTLFIVPPSLNPSTFRSERSADKLGQS